MSSGNCVSTSGLGKHKIENVYYDPGWPDQFIPSPASQKTKDKKPVDSVTDTSTFACRRKTLFQTPTAP